MLHYGHLSSPECVACDRVGKPLTIQAWGGCIVRNQFFRLPIFLLSFMYFLLASCTPTMPPRTRTVEAPKLTCEQANRLAYRSVTTLGHPVESVQVATPGSVGYIVAGPREGDGGGRVTITCGTIGATVVPEKAGAGIPSFVGAAERPGGFHNNFARTFGILAHSQEVYAKQEAKGGLNMKLTPYNGFESQIELGSDLPASGILPVKVEIHNNTPRPYGIELDKVYLRAAGGGRVTPVAAPAAGQSKALQADTIQPGQEVTGFLFYPMGTYSSASTIMIDKENNEREGFSIQFEQ